MQHSADPAGSSANLRWNLIVCTGELHRRHLSLMRQRTHSAQLPVGYNMDRQCAPLFGSLAFTLIPPDELYR